MKLLPVRSHLVILLAGLLTAFSASAEVQLDAARIHEIAAMLPDQPAGFGWPISDRSHWDKLAQDPAFSGTVSAAEKLIARPLAEVPDDLFLEFSRNGNRTHWQDAEFARRGRVEKLTLAEAFENKGKFLLALEATIASLCAEKTWVYPAHDGSLANFHGQEITPDLGATGLSSELAEADYILGDKLSSKTRQLIRDNIRRRVLDPFRAMIEGRQKETFWIRAKMNWNAVCVGNTVFAALALEPSRDERAFFAAAGERCIQFYLAGFTPDGYCAEGIGYWNYGFGHFILLTEALRQATGGKIDLMDDQTAIAPAMYCLRSEIFPGIFPTIADCSPGTRPNAQLKAYICHRLGLLSDTNRLAGEMSTLAQTMMLSSLDESLPLVTKSKASDDSPLRSAFTGGGVVISRTEPGMKPALAAVMKGGNNDEPHNHNDVGSFSVVVGHDMLICDPGGEVYTKRTFGPHRYDSKVLSSFGHALPVIAGQLEKAGADAHGVILETNFTPATDTFKLDIRSAYPVPELKKLERTFVFQREPSPSLEVADEVKFTKPESFETALITWGEIKQLDDATWQISDGDDAVRVKIDAQGHTFHSRQEMIDEDVQSKRKPYRLGITLDDKIESAIIRFHIEPVTR